MMNIVILSCINLQTCVAIYLFNILKPKDSFEKILNAFLFILLVHLGIKLSLLVVLKSDFLYNKNPSGFGTAYGPLLYLLTRAFMVPTVARRTVALHMAPFLLFTLVFFVNSVGYLQGVISPRFINTYAYIYQVCSLMSLTIYPVVSWQLLKRHTAGDPEVSYKSGLLKAIIRILLSAILLWFAGTAIYYLKTGRGDLNAWILPYLCFIILLVLMLRYKMETMRMIPKLPETPAVKEAIAVTPGRQYRKSALDQKKMDEYEANIRNFMDKSKIYLEPEISLEDLAERVQIPKHHITQLLSERFNKNFYTFINEYRIREAIHKLKDPGLDVNILAMAYDCGFNSKSSFNSYFKKITGLTPSAYRKEMQHNVPVTIR